jgi:hypothetical protein
MTEKYMMALYLKRLTIYEIKNKEEEISFSMKECYRIFAFLKNNIEGYKYDTSYMDHIIDKLFSQSNIALENINELYIKI